MTRKDDLPEIAELEEEIDDFLIKLSQAQDQQEAEMYRQMIKINIVLIKDLLRR